MLHILLVEDQLELRAIHGTYLAEHGYEVAQAASGKISGRGLGSPKRVRSNPCSTMAFCRLPPSSQLEVRVTYSTSCLIRSNPLHPFQSASPS